MKYIQYHGVWDTEELYDLASDPDEMHNLIDDPTWREQRIALRAKLQAGLARSNGDNVIPYTPRNAEGIVWRNGNANGAVAAPFPDEWVKSPNRADRFVGLIPETPAPKPEE